MDGEAGRGEGRSKTGEGENQETLFPALRAAATEMLCCQDQSLLNERSMAASAAQETAKFTMQMMALHARDITDEDTERGSGEREARAMRRV